MGSIDTINYDERYASIVEDYELMNSCLVYHVIELQDKSIALLYVGKDANGWETERPTISGVFAHVCFLDGSKGKSGYIKLDSLQGALYRKDEQIYDSIQKRKMNYLAVCQMKLMKDLKY